MGKCNCYCICKTKYFAIKNIVKCIYLEYFLITETLLGNNSILKLRPNQSEGTCVSVVHAGIVSN